MPVIVLTGGGTAGHVTPHLALLPRLKEQGWDVHYIGSKEGIERSLVAGIPYSPVATGKLRRYFDWRNFVDPLRVLLGTVQAFVLLGRIRPTVVFSKGGFVSVPVAVAAKLRRIPVVLHESDITPGLANRLVLPFADRVCVTFPETAAHFAENKVTVTGTPLREALFAGDRPQGLAICQFTPGRPVLLVMGGSSGSAVLNGALRQALDVLTRTYQIIHLCGRGNLDGSLEGHPAYRQFEYAAEDLPHLLAAADFVVSRAGANSLFELLALKKPNLLVPLSRKSSRGDQIANAASFAKQGFSRVLAEEDLTAEVLAAEIAAGWEQRESQRAAMAAWPASDGTAVILDILQAYAKEPA